MSATLLVPWDEGAARDFAAPGGAAGGAVFEPVQQQPQAGQYGREYREPGIRSAIHAGPAGAVSRPGTRPTSMPAEVTVINAAWPRPSCCT